MSLFFGGEKVQAVLFSPLEGQLTFGGKPASGAKLTLWIKWKDQKGEQLTYTADDNGFFAIPKIAAMYKPSLAELVITQVITVHYQQQSYEIWIMSKRLTGEYTELGGKPVGVLCELTDNASTVRGIRSLGGTSCTWKLLEKMNFDGNN